MPYISTENVKKIRQALKAEFPSVKFSITRNHAIEISIKVLESNIDFKEYNSRERTYSQASSINEYWYKEQFKYNPEALEFCIKLFETIQKTHPHYDIDDSPDYGLIPNYYLNIYIGSWDKPYVLKSK